VSYVRAIAPRLALGPGATYALVSAFSADLGNTVVFPSLCGGGCLHVIASERVTDPDAMAAYFRREGIDCLKIVPSHLSALLSGAHPADVLPRRVLVLGGEASSWDLIERIHTLSPGTAVLNHYGPTETTVGVLTQRVAREGRDPRAPIVPLGRPLGGVAVYLLDAEGGPVPVGVPGEVYVGGAQVTRGYLNRPALTAERFVPDPFHDGGARLYRTGDRARWLDDGTVLFLGRADHQVKVRGYRVELGEIEVALEQHPAVRDAVVLALDDATLGKRLAAFVLTEPAATAAEILAFLASLLPGHMIPGSIKLLAAWPLLPNGKVDRRALAALEQEEQAEAPDDAPRDPVEEVIEAIWADVFGREHVGIHERFDALGGHSLLAIQLIARVRDAFQVEVPLRAVFEAPTIAELAGRVEALRQEGGAPVMPPIEPAPRGAPLPLSFSQERLWFLDRLDPGSALYNVASARRLFGPLDAPVLERALREVVRRHEVLRTTFALADGRPVQVIHDEVDLRLPVEDVSALPEAEREALVAERASAEARRPFDLARGPVLRLRLLRLGPEEHVLVSVLHHIVSDAWTQGVLHEEVGKLYDAFRAGAPSPLPPMPVQYADYAVWQRRWLSGAVLDGQIAWWKAHLAGAPAAIELPTDRPRPPMMSYRGGRQSFSLAPEPSRALVALGRREGATLFMVLLSAFDVLLARWSGQRGVVVGMPIAGRTRAQTEGLIGFFVNTLALYTRLDDEPSFVDLLARVREACLGAYAHQDLPFERLVDELNPARDLSRTPLFQVMLVLQNPQRESRASASAAPARRAVVADSGTSKFDLTLVLGETPRGIAGNLEYAADLFDAPTIARMLGHLGILLAGIAEAPERPVFDLPLLAPDERSRLLVEWNDTAAAYAKDTCLHALFEAHAALTPNAVAVASGGRALTYRELDARSNRLARHLRGRGVAPASRVAICVERSVDMVVGLLGILKAGAAYVPLDPTYPRARLASMVADAGLGAAVTQDALAWVLGGAPVPVVRLDADRDAIDAEDAAPLGRSAGPGSVAYVIYTSGSTGTPKGVEVPHRAVVAFLAAMAREPGLDAGDCLVAVTSLSFDIAGLSSGCRSRWGRGSRSRAARRRPTAPRWPSSSTAPAPP
jgi:non-ribosomal peptide synthetase component F/acyl carrier protein